MSTAVMRKEDAMKSCIGDETEVGFHSAKGSAEAKDEAKPQPGGFTGRPSGRFRERSARSGEFWGCGESVMSASARVCPWSPDFGFMQHRSHGRAGDQVFGIKEFRKH